MQQLLRPSANVIVDVRPRYVDTQLDRLAVHVVPEIKKELLVGASVKSCGSDADTHGNTVRFYGS